MICMHCDYLRIPVLSVTACYESNGPTSVKMEYKKCRLSSLTIAELTVTASGLGAEEL